MEYTFDYKQILESKEFSEKVNTSLYAQRGQTNNEKRIKDAFIGKLGEVAAYHLLKNKISNLSYPDFKIYSAKEKSWDFDLKGDNFNIHVKSQNVEQGKRYGTSWLFQKGNGKAKHYDKEIFDKLSPNQYIAFMTVDLVGQTSELKAFTTLDLLHDQNLFDEPKLSYLQFGNKCAVYYDSLVKFKDQFYDIT